MIPLHHKAIPNYVKDNLQNNVAQQLQRSILRVVPEHYYNVAYNQIKSSFSDAIQRQMDLASIAMKSPLSMAFKNTEYILSHISKLQDNLKWVKEIQQYQNISDTISRLKNQSAIFDAIQKQQNNIVFRTAKEFEYLNSSLYTNLNLGLSKSLFEHRFSIPVNILNALNSINVYQERFDTILLSITKQFSFLKQQNNNWNSISQAYNKSLSSIITKSLNNSDWESLMVIQELEETITNYPTQTDTLAEYYNKINIWTKNVSNLLKQIKEKHPFVYYSSQILWFILSAYFTFGFNQDSQPQEQNISNNAIAEDINSIQESIESLRQEMEKKEVALNMDCKVYFKPNGNSKVVDSLSENDEILLLQTNNKWVLISYTKGVGDICTGWILKKYLK